MIISIANYFTLKNQSKRLTQNINELKQKGIKDSQVMYLDMMLEILNVEIEYYKNRIFKQILIGITFIGFIIGVLFYYGIKI